MEIYKRNIKIFFYSCQILLFVIINDNSLWIILYISVYTYVFVPIHMAFYIVPVFLI